jgi:septal ring factor EnvC (AmiA/AmiB activator)
MMPGNLGDDRNAMSRLNIIGSVMAAVMVSAVLNACVTPPATKVDQKSDSDLSGRVQALQKQIQEREKRIEEQDKRIQELESQIEALRLIDQDREMQRKPVRPPTTVEPLQ